MFCNHVYMLITNQKTYQYVCNIINFLGRNLPLLTSTQCFPVLWMIMNWLDGKLETPLSQLTRDLSFMTFAFLRADLVKVVPGYISNTQIIISHCIIGLSIKYEGQENTTATFFQVTNYILHGVLANKMNEKEFLLLISNTMYFNSQMYYTYTLYICIYARMLLNTLHWNRQHSTVKKKKNVKRADYDKPCCHNRC